MKTLLRGHLKKKLAEFATQRLSNAATRPTIITITGSVGKTGTKEAIATALGKEDVLVSEGNYNTAFGVPLTILGLKGGGGSFSEWKRILAEAKEIAETPWEDVPKYLVLELAVDHPGDMEELREIVTPDIAVITPIPNMPVHGKFFPSAEELAEEKGKMIKNVAEGTAFLAGSEPLTTALARGTGMKTLTYGMATGDDVQMTEPELLIDERGPYGLSGKVVLDGATVPMRLNRVIAPTQFLAAGVALAVANAAGQNPVEVLARLEDWEPPQRRMQLKRTVEGMAIIDDTYNASPVAVRAALNFMKEFPVLGRRIAVLGDMRELDSAIEEQAHTEVGKLAASSVDLLIAVGERRSWLADAANKAGGEAREAEDKEAVARELAALELTKEDAVLFKASRAIGLDEVVDALTRTPSSKTAE